MHQTLLCMESSIDCTTMIDVLKRLEKRDLIRRERSEQDRRQRITWLSGNRRIPIKRFG
ncbi:MarR family transcriptional regulator [Mycetohabitans sp. B2]|uniref:MarR family transcriptional regulator n=1 Tax=unclassified Mycetohabitans TaxID=2622646 RepID=UPI00351D4295|nr:MarR family transcriptional regulator [Mycetohabitans sp. B2]MCG1045983.1 MarR family transcriptional regulator [Mycetohabitans sp. B6]